MNFYFVYIVFPILLFLLFPRKDNKLLYIYWAFVVIFSYDNVTDFLFYYDEFSEYRSHTSFDIGKDREYLWCFFFRLLTFTKYGTTIIHMIVMTIIVWAFTHWSKKQNLLFYSILLYFIMNLAWKHDNILRQDIAMVIGYYCFFKFLTEPRISIRLFAKIAGLTIIAFLFHYSALLFIPYCYIIRYLSRINMRLSIAFLIVVAFVTISQLEMVADLLQKGAIFFTLISGETAEYYLIKLQDLEMTANGKIGIVISIFSLLPLFYFKLLAKERYNKNKILRVCVNLSWVSIVWRNAMSADLMARPVEYFMWFQVWGVAYFLDDVARYGSKRILMSVAGIVYCILFIYQEASFISRYYGNNTYMTIFTKESVDMKIYDREQGIKGEEDFDYKRVR